MSGDRIRELRASMGLSQGDLAEMAGVSRQMISAIEGGRHLPRVDAALGLARALGVAVTDLFAPEMGPIDVITGEPPGEGALIRVGMVGDQQVVTRAGVESSGWSSADAVIENGLVRRLSSLAPGPVMVGCEPGLEVIGQDLREARRGAVSVAASSRAAREALGAGRAHIAVVHAAPGELPGAGQATQRFHLCSWRVGLAASPDSAEGWAAAAMSGAVPVIQREAGAGVQAAFERAAGVGVEGPRSSGHIDAVKMALATGMPAVTIEPAAIALGAAFHPLETHDAEVWVPAELAGDPVVEAALNDMVGERFRRRLLGIGGYDLGRIGLRAA